MYALNTFFRLVRFLANTAIGLAVGFGLGVAYSNGDLGQIINTFLSNNT